MRETHRAVWVAAPAGAGKTSLVTSYLFDRKVPMLWYQMDRADGDVASFFYYMGLAAKIAAPRTRKAMPLLSAEYLADIPTFVRNFFRELYRRLPERCVLVFDDYQEAPSGGPLDEVLSIAIEEMPEGMNLLVLARSRPPAVLARAQMRDQAAVIGWDLIRFTREETDGFASLLSDDDAVNESVLDSLHRRTNGWAAGLALLLQPSVAFERAENMDQEELPEVLFDYFAAEVMRHTEDLAQEILMRCALLPQMSVAAATALSGNVRAGSILLELSSRNYFVARHLGERVTYEFHPLFREFLLRELERRHTPEVVRDFQRRAATVLVDEDQFEAALPLLQKSADLHSLARLIVSRAPELVAQGRYQTLDAWLRTLPEDTHGTMPWVSYWLGCVTMLSNPVEARAQYERAYHAFLDKQDPAGLYLAWAGIAESYVFQWDDFSDVKLWLAAYERLQETYPEVHSPEIEARVTAGMFGVLTYVQPQHPDIAKWCGKVEALLQAGLDADFKIRLMHEMALYYAWLGQFEKLRGLVEMARTLVENNRTEPFSRVILAFLQVMHSWLIGEPGDAVGVTRDAREVADRSGVHVMDTLLTAQVIYAHGVRADTDAMGKELEMIHAMTSPARRLHVAHYHYQKGWYESLMNNHAQALAHRRQALELAERLSAQAPIALINMGLAQTLADTGAYAEALERVEAALAIARAMHSRYFEFVSEMVRAHVYVSQEKWEACADSLRTALRLAREDGYWTFPAWNPAMVSRLCGFALQNGIEVEFVRALIRKWSLRPEPPSGTAGNDWPYEVRLHVFGRFTVAVNDALLSISRSIKKPLDLLQALVALGGRGVPEEALSEALWPDAEGDAAYKALKTNVQRLRRILPEGVIIWSEGKLSLDGQRVWVDLWMLERELGMFEDALRNGNATDFRSVGPGRLFDLYRNGFLPDNTQHWTLAVRERLHNRSLRVVGDFVKHLEPLDPSAAISFYEKAIEIDPLREALYQGVMRCYQQLNQPAEVSRTYQRCREILKRELGLSLSEATDTLYKASQRH